VSFTITTDVFCDECSDWTSGVSGPHNGKREAWRNAKSRGWAKRRGKHLCPVCNGIAHYKYADGGYSFKDKPPGARK
jgi:hypothetical protein